MSLSLTLDTWTRTIYKLHKHNRYRMFVTWQMETYTNKFTCNWWPHFILASAGHRTIELHKTDQLMWQTIWLQSGWHLTHNMWHMTRYRINNRQCSSTGKLYTSLQNRVYCATCGSCWLQWDSLSLAIITWSIYIMKWEMSFLNLGKIFCLNLFDNIHKMRALRS